MFISGELCKVFLALFFVLPSNIFLFLCANNSEVQEVIKIVQLCRNSRQTFSEIT